VVVLQLHELRAHRPCVASKRSPLRMLLDNIEVCSRNNILFYQGSQQWSNQYVIAIVLGCRVTSTGCA